MSNKLRNFFEFIIFGFLMFVSIILALDKRYSTATLNGIMLWATIILPSLFPYFFITFIFSSLKLTGKISSFLSPFTRVLFNVNGSVGYAFFMSLISGYPIGAKTVADLKEQGAISDTECIRASALCSTSSPMFLIGSVGSLMFKNSLFGMLLFLTHILSIILIGMIFSFYKKNDKPTKSKSLLINNKIDNILYNGVYSSVISALIVGGIITVFYLLTEILLNLNLLSPIINLFALLTNDKDIAKSLVLGAFECTKGLTSLSLTEQNILTLPIASFICSFGGLSVIAQSLACLKKAKIKTAPFIFSKIISAVISFFIALFFSVIYL